jgi:hypothetical protein
MIITILKEEFEEGVLELFESEQVDHFSIDYATNAIHGWYGDKDIIVFKFKGYGFINDNRYNKYDLIRNEKGFILKITKT